jgi:hypothetical protein
MEFRNRAANTTRADPVPYEDRLSHREGIVTISEKKVKTPTFLGSGSSHHPEIPAIVKTRQAGSH